MGKGERRKYRETTGLQNLVHNFVVHKLVYQEKVSYVDTDGRNVWSLIYYLFDIYLQHLYNSYFFLLSHNAKLSQQLSS